MRIVIVICFLLCACGTWGVPAAAQEASKSSLRPLLPLVPSNQPRNLESDQDRFVQPPSGPVAGFVESVSTSDAIIEIVVGHGRILTTREPIALEGGIALVAAGDPTVVDFEVAGPRLIRILGNRVGETDLSITTDTGETYSFDVHVVYDLELTSAYLRQAFPNALIELKQIREHVILSGQARSVVQVSQIAQTLQAFLASAQVERQVQQTNSNRPEQPGQAQPRDERPANERPTSPREAPRGPAPINVRDERPQTQGTIIQPQIINLMRVPGVQQVMLKVQVAELNRTALREIGADLDKVFDGGTTTISTFLANDITSTAIGIFDSGDFSLFLSALRSNSVASILAEPNLIALNGQEASFLAGGEFPVPVPQTSGGGNTITVQFKEFGVLLNFVPTILDDETIRLRVAPEVSDVDDSTAVVIDNFFVPGLRTRRVNTTVELKQGQTLALAGLLQVDLNANTHRIPGLGDLPYLGPFFSNTTHERVEKELLVMVTPYLASPMDVCQVVPPMPGTEVLDPNDKEFYFLNRIEGRTGTPFRAPTEYDDALHLRYLFELESRHCYGPVGYSD